MRTRIARIARAGALASALLLFCGAASAAAAPVLEAESSSARFGSHFVPGDKGRYEIVVRNSGDEPTSGPITVVDTMPSGFTAVEASDQIGYWTCSVAPGGGSVSCEGPNFPIPVAPGFAACEQFGLEARCRIAVTVEVAPDAGAEPAHQVELCGGGAADCTTSGFPIRVNEPEFGIAAFDGASLTQAGEVADEAGAHPYSLTTSISFESHPNQHPGEEGNTLFQPQPDGRTRSIEVDLPSGLIGNPAAVIECPVELMEGQGTACPPSSQIGTVTIRFDREKNEVGLYRLADPVDGPALFGFPFIGVGAVLIKPYLRSDGDYGFRVVSDAISQAETLVGVDVTVWGVPADPSHDEQRCLSREAESNLCTGTPGDTTSGPNPSGLPRRAFLANPTDCSAGPMKTVARADSWERPGAFDEASFLTHQPGEPGNTYGLTDCENVPFDPAIEVVPTTTQADSPTGLDVRLEIPQSDNPDGRATAQLEDAIVTLPEGMTINPAAADGLGACTPAQVGLVERAPAKPRFDLAEDSCPDSSKLGTVEVDTPLLEEPLEGEIFQATQNDNAFDSLISLYMVIRGPGILVKLPGKVSPDPQSGNLVATFEDNPPIPFESFELHFKGGSRAPLVTPPSCGTHTVTTSFTPNSAFPAPPAPRVADPGMVKHPTSSFQITSGPNGRPCPTGGFEPSFQAGTLNPIAGAYSPLIVNASRPDGSQPLRGLELDLPEGLLGKLAGIPYCPEAALAAAASRQGRSEQASPSCPAASRVGGVTVAAGAGSTPFHVQGKAYLAGPYKGAPLSIATVTPAVAGPFDLGTVVVRARADVDPVTTKIHVTSDPIPQILQGIPLKVRSVSVNTDRPEFTLNPTDCDPTSLGGTLFGVSVLKAVSSRFQVGACKALDFKPRLALALKGGTKRSQNPALRATLTFPRAEQANIERVSVALPRSAFLDQSHIRTVCTRVQFAADACPAGSVYGRARAFSPLLDQPLEGPVYLRSSNNPLPDLVVALKGQIEVELAGRIDSAKGGIRTTFALVPDAPVSKFVLAMKGGKRSLLENSRNLCASTNRATVEMDAQSGKVHDFRPVVKPRCGKGKAGR